MRTTALALVISLLTLTASQAFAQDAPQWRKVADAIPLGTKVKIQRLDGSRVSGTLDACRRHRVDAEEEHSAPGSVHRGNFRSNRPHRARTRRRYELGQGDRHRSRRRRRRDPDDPRDCSAAGLAEIGVGQDGYQRRGRAAHACRAAIRTARRESSRFRGASPRGSAS